MRAVVDIVGFVGRKGLNYMFVSYRNVFAFHSFVFQKALFIIQKASGKEYILFGILRWCRNSVKVSP